MSEQLTGAEQEKPERTRESEIQANIKFWLDLGIEISEEDVRREIEAISEVEGFDWYTIIPKGLKMSEIWQKAKGNYSWIKKLDAIKMPRNTTDIYAVAARHTQEPDDESIGENAKTVEDWEATGKTYMSPLERVVTDMRWYAENGTHLDRQNTTMCPGSRTTNGKIPALVCSNNLLGLEECDSSTDDPNYGVRQVVVKGPKTEQDETSIEERRRLSIKEFEEVRDIPYRIPLSITERNDCCSGKVVLLFKRLNDLGYNCRYRICTFRWSDLDLPDEVIKIPHKDESTHVYLEVEIDGAWKNLDPSWDKSLYKILPVNNWDGKSDTKIAVPALELYSTKKSGEFAEQEQLSEDSKKIIEEHIRENGPFFNAFNNWLESNRIKEEEE